MFPFHLKIEARHEDVPIFQSIIVCLSFSCQKETFIGTYGKTNHVFINALWCVVIKKK